MRSLLFLLTFGLSFPVLADPPLEPVRQRFADPLPAPPREPFKDGKFEIRPGEVIVFTGGTSMVRLIEDGWFEMSLALASRDQKPRFRNMAWEGDTVYEQWRDQNFGSWREQFDAVNASCIVTWFGQMEALDTSRDDAAFAKACAALLDEYKAVTPRLVVILPAPFETAEKAGVFPSLVPGNERMATLSGIMKGLALDRGAIVVDLKGLKNFPRQESSPPVTINGVHPGTEALRSLFTPLLDKALGIPGESLSLGSPVLSGIREKNRLWHDCWKTMNWAFAYSDRTQQPFGRGIGSHPSMAKELEQYKVLLREADARIHDAAQGREASPVVAKPAPVPPPPLPPEQERATFKPRDGFEVNLFASEADGLVKPLSMRWDERGRLWAACSPSYPQLVPGEPHGDYILICEDTNGDGRADKFTRFAEGLTMPMGLEFGDGGVYVCESTQLVFLPNDGSDRAGERQVILSGFGTGDSHQMINSLRWGPDGCLWFSQGLHIFSRIETPWGIVRFDRAGIWRFNPRTWKLQGFFGNAAAGANCWGVTFDDWGQVFHCAADDRPGFYTTAGLGTWPNPPRYYEIGSLAVSPVKGMCMEYIAGSHLPPELNGVLCKPVYFSNQLQLYKLVDDGSGFKTQELGPLLTSPETAFRPLGVQTGPDGALYICDWYNPVIGHYQASYRDPNRDKTHGRIWRLTAKDRLLTKRPVLEKMGTPELIAQLTSPERWARDQATRLLFFKKDAAPLLEAEALKPEATPAFLLSALGVQAARGEISDQVLAKCLGGTEANLRAFAVRVWSQQGFADEATISPDEEEDAEKRLANMVNDPHPRVRLEAVIAAGYLKSPVSVVIACAALDQPRDRFIDYALANTVRALKPWWTPALESGKLTFEGNTAHLGYVLETDGGKNLSAVLRHITKREDLSVEQRAFFTKLFVTTGSASDLTALYAEAPPTPALVEALAARAGTLPGLALPERVKDKIPAWLDSGSAEERAAALNVVRAFQAVEFTARVKALVGKPDRAALAVYAALAREAAIPDLTTLFRSHQDAAIQEEALKALAPLKLTLAAAEFAGQSVSPDLAPRLLKIFLERENGTVELAKALEGKPPVKETAQALLASLATAGRADAELLAVLQKAAGMASGAAPAEYSADFVTKLIASTRAAGDAKRGGEVFRMAKSACAACHKVGNEGGITGPDLTAIGRGMTPELITESVLWPKLQIKEGFFLTTVTTRDGRILSGYKRAGDDKTLTLLPPGGTETLSVATKDIAERADAGTLMPEGLTAGMTEQERLDLLAYLFQLGK